MKIPIYQIDVFSAKTFGGNPAAVCPLPAWIDDAAMQAIAAENNIFVTAYVVPAGEDGYDVRWFTPKVELTLCGHGTLASAYVVFNRQKPGTNAVTFGSRSGPLHVSLKDGRVELDLPAMPATPCAAPAGTVEALGAAPVQTLHASSLVAVFDAESQVRSLAPDMTLLARIDPHGVIVTAPGSDVDFVTRFFAPNLGIPEDPATGSAHCTLTPYWSARLGKQSLRARQVSERGGELWCEMVGDRVRLAGYAAPYLEGTIEI
jgi:PhzF family phenazine biosynthesis protein